MKREVDDLWSSLTGYARRSGADKVDCPPDPGFTESVRREAQRRAAQAKTVERRIVWTASAVACAASLWMILLCRDAIEAYRESPPVALADVVQLELLP